MEGREEGGENVLFSISFRCATHATLRCAKAIKINNGQQLPTTAIPSSADVFLLAQISTRLIVLSNCHLLCLTNPHERHSNPFTFTFTFSANTPLSCRTLHHHNFSTNSSTTFST